MSLTDIAAALIGLRETTYKEHQRLRDELAEVQSELASLRESIDVTLNERLAQSAQAFRDIQQRVEEQYQRRFEAMLRTVIGAAERLDRLAEDGPDSDDLDELRERLRSCAAPRDALRRLLDDAGVVRLETVGAPYDPLLHEVIRREHRPGVTAEHVIEELRPGYLAGREQVVQRARVVVAAPRMDEADA